MRVSPDAMVEGESYICVSEEPQLFVTLNEWLQTTLPEMIEAQTGNLVDDLLGRPDHPDRENWIARITGLLGNALRTSHAEKLEAQLEGRDAVKH